MDKVKKEIGYWCDDIVKKRFLGQGVTVAVLDTGERVSLLSIIEKNIKKNRNLKKICYNHLMAFKIRERELCCCYSFVYGLFLMGRLQRR